MPSLNIEHIAWNVSDPAAMAAWYVEHLGMRILRSSPAPPYMHFLADASGRVVIELYRNTIDPIPDYAAMHPARFHLAFAAEHLDTVGTALVSAGATLVDDQTVADGSRLLMLRDPWGLALQLVRRATSLLPAE
jgi:catechol 2,3-dioxygenase-like lactoylglutathione lyase family enzyme